MKKTIAIVVGSTLLITVGAAAFGGRTSAVSYIDNYRGMIEQNYEDCLSAMQFGSEESAAAQPKWCQNWWNKLPASEKTPIGAQSENSYPAEQDVVKP